MIDIVFGGPPCQGFSVAGKMDPNDARSQLIWKFVESVDTVRPKAFVMENVKALAKLEKWAGVRELYLSKMEQLGYDVRYVVLNAMDYGVSQKRERVFFIGVQKEFNAPLCNLENHLLKQRKKSKTLRELLKQLPRAGSDGNPLSCTAKITLASNPVMRKSPYAGMYFNGMGRPMDLEGFANTLPASMGGNKTPIIDDRYLNDPDAPDWIGGYHRQLMDSTTTPHLVEIPSFLRRLTITEAAMIQSFPPDYKFIGSKTAIYRQIGNAVPCALAEAVATAVIKMMNEDCSPNE